jgi:hypothetical protein
VFDLSNLDHVQVDHLLADTQYRVLRAFRDASGASHAEGEVFLYRSAHLNMTARRLTLRVEQPEGNKKEWLLVYEDRGEEPRPGNLKNYFEDAGYVGVRPEVRAEEKRLAAEAAPPPEPGPPPAAPGGGGDLEEVYALAIRGEFDAAGALLKQIDESRALGDYHLEKLGSWLLEAARRSGGGKPGQWLARQAMNQWEFWAACSTSGGEGAARSYEVKQIRKGLAGLL